MIIKEHQKKAILKDIPPTLTLILFITVVFAFYTVGTAGSATMAGLSFVLFFILLSFYLACTIPVLVKVYRIELQEKRHYLWYIPGILSCFLILYSSTIGSFSLVLSAAALFYCFAPMLLLTKILKKGYGPHPLDVLLMVLLYLFSVLMSQYSIGLPPLQKFIDLFYLTGIVLFVFIYVVMREIPFSLRCKFAEIRIALYSFMVFLVIVLLFLLASGTMDMTHYSSAGLNLVVRTVILAFFVALPEELAFRGVILEFLSRSLPSQKGRHYMALGASALIFAAAHIPACRFFDASIYSGIPFSDQSPVIRFAVMMVAGLFYGHVYLKTKKVAASALTHFLVIWFWVVLFNG
jgi:membrane protease YdiL (CAAX protease family)